MANKTKLARDFKQECDAPFDTFFGQKTGDNRNADEPLWMRPALAARREADAQANDNGKIIWKPVPLPEKDEDASYQQGSRHQSKDGLSLVGTSCLVTPRKSTTDRSLLPHRNR